MLTLLASPPCKAAGPTVRKALTVSAGCLLLRPVLRTTPSLSRAINEWLSQRMFVIDFEANTDVDGYRN